MNREQAKELLPVIQAFAEGKTIQSRIIDSLQWFDLTEESTFDLLNCEYRIKPSYRPFKNGGELMQKEMQKDNLSNISDREGYVITSLKSVIKDLNDIQGASDADDNKMVDVACKLHKVIGIIKGI